VLRALERVGIGSAKLRAVVGEELRDRQQSILDRWLQGQKLGLEVVMELDSPRHLYSR
jgi:hypothetical protein